MIALLFSCSLSWCQISIDDPDDDIFFTGDEEQTDSVLVPVSALRIANAKMIELEYEKEINSELRNIIENDSILIDALSSNLGACEIAYNEKDAEVKEMKKQRNIAIGAGGFIIVLISLLSIL